jgi:hypothetical protein
MGVRRVYRGLLTSGVIGMTMLATGTPVAGAQNATAPGCEQQTPQTLGGSPPRAAARAGGKESAVTLAPANDNSKVVERNFGQGRDVYRRTLLFVADHQLSVAPAEVSVSIAGGLVDPKTTEVFPVEHGQVTFGVETNPDTPETLAVRICIDPSRPVPVPPGQYLGTILIAGRHIVPAQIPVTLTVKSAKELLVWIMAIAGLALGLGVRFLADHVNPPATSGESDANHGSVFIRWASMIVVGVILTVGVVIKLYYEPTVFGDAFSNFWPITVGAATATAGGTTIVTLFKGT